MDNTPKLEEKNNEAKKYKMLLDKYDVDTEDLSQLEDILKNYNKWQLELDEIMNKGTCGYCKMKHDKLQEENEQLKDTVDILRGILRVDDPEFFEDDDYIRDGFIQKADDNGLEENQRAIESETITKISKNWISIKELIKGMKDYES